jgi:site-specific recombinase XerC
VLNHVTSKRQKMINPDLRLMPMVLEELQTIYGFAGDRATLPASGPMIVCDRTGRPWTAHYFRQRWREIAKAVGVPDDVWNMDSRSGGISEATDAGAQLEDVRHAATHSNIATTQRYSRGSADKAAKVQRLRVVHRKGTP